MIVCHCLKCLKKIIFNQEYYSKTTIINLSSFCSHRHLGQVGNSSPLYYSYNVFKNKYFLLWRRLWTENQTTNVKVSIFQVLSLIWCRENRPIGHVKLRSILTELYNRLSFWKKNCIFSKVYNFLKIILKTCHIYFEIFF